MKETTKRRVRGALIALVCFLLGGLVTLGVVWKVVGQDGRTLLQAYQLIRSEFVGEYDSQTHLETTLETMVDALGDRWSYYLTPEEAQQVKANRENTYVGIGITVGQNVEDGLEILRVTEGSPAQEAGLQAGEIIRGVDGQAITSDNRETMLSAIQGEEGTTVSLEVEGTDGARRTVEVTRQEIHGVTATWTMTENQVGLVNGLAWTAVGGTLLEAEANVIPGSGKVELTGNLGNVMKESARAAFTYIRSRAVQLGIEANFYKEKDIHVHFPEGAVPKDGPSAGVTITTAMVSALTGIPVRGDVAMTGEVTLRGRVLPIGGLREKSMAALRNGIHTVIIPKDNEPDLEEIDQTVRSALQFIPVDHVDQVLANALERPPLAQPDQAGGQVPVVGPETGSTHATIPQA